jgi:hypothetical protein
MGARVLGAEILPDALRGIVREADAGTERRREPRAVERIGAPRCPGVGLEPRQRPAMRRAASGERQHDRIGVRPYSDRPHAPSFMQLAVVGTAIEGELGS